MRSPDRTIDVLELLLASLLAAPAGSAPPRQEPEQERVVYMGRAFLFEADVAAGRAAGWADPGATDDGVLDAVAATLQARLRSSGRFLEARAAREEGARLSVTFVGPQAKSIEDFLVAGLTSPGRLVLRPVARAEDAAALGTSLEAERERLRAWTAADPARTVAGFRRVPRDEGGPPPGLLWLAGDGDEPLALLPRPEHVVDWSERERVGTASSRVAGRYDLSLSLNERGRRELAAFLETQAGRPVAVTLNDVLVERDVAAPAAEGPLVLALALEREEVLPLVFAAAGEPLRAPVRFVGFDKRPLLGVAGDGDEDGN